MNETVCRCLYCNTVTGRYPSAKPEQRATVCGRCQWKPGRSERREIQAGAYDGRPWMRPLSFWVHFLGHIPIPDDEAARYQCDWDERQREIKEFNERHP